MPVPGPMRMQGTWGSWGRWNPGALHTSKTPVKPKQDAPSLAPAHCKLRHHPEREGEKTRWYLRKQHFSAEELYAGGTSLLANPALFSPHP